jgi:hypothetical protein
MRGGDKDNCDNDVKKKEEGRVVNDLRLLIKPQCF